MTKHLHALTTLRRKESIMPKLKSFIEFKSFDEDTKHPKQTKVFLVRRKDNLTPLGEITWSTAWRRYIFQPHSNTSFDASCLQEIADFIGEQTLERKKLWKIYNRT